LESGIAAVVPIRGAFPQGGVGDRLESERLRLGTKREAEPEQQTHRHNLLGAHTSPLEGEALDGDPKSRSRPD
jgi:hypothetical protein